MTHTCPTNKRSPGDVVGCGHVFDGRPDGEGLVDCPECGLWFEGSSVPTEKQPNTDNAWCDGCSPDNCPGCGGAPKVDVGTMTVKALRDAGFAVCVFSPGELQGADPGSVEDRMCDQGWSVIGTICEEQRYGE